MNLNNKLLRDSGAFDPEERSKSRTKQRLLAVAVESRRFTDEEMVSLDAEIYKYIDLPESLVPKFVVEIDNIVI